LANSITVRAPSSTANLGPGFDVFGLALDAFFDEVKLSKRKEKGIKIISKDPIPVNPTKNTAGLVVKAMLKKFKINSGIEIKIKKGVPPGYGVGSSAASAAAATVAFDKGISPWANPPKLRPRKMFVVNVYTSPSAS